MALPVWLRLWPSVYPSSSSLSLKMNKGRSRISKEELEASRDRLVYRLTWLRSWTKGQPQTYCWPFPSLGGIYMSLDCKYSRDGRKQIWTQFQAILILFCSKCKIMFFFFSLTPWHNNNNNNKKHTHTGKKKRTSQKVNMETKDTL